MFRRDISAVALLGFALCACRAAELEPDPDVSSSSLNAGGGSGGETATGGAEPSGGAGGAAEPSPDDPSLLSWNLESFPLTPGAIAQAATLIDELAPDVVALQEIAEPAAFTELLDELDDYYGVLNDDPGAYLRLGLLYRHDRVHISDVETLFADDWYAFPRPPLKAHVTIEGDTPMDFVAVVIHLKAQLDGESEARRRAGCEALDQWVRAEQEAATEQDFVLLGDFNDKLTDPPQWNVFSSFLDQPQLYSFLTLPLAEAGEHTYIPFESMIDHILVTSDTLDEVGSGATEVLPLEQQIAGYESLTDHRPVRTWLRGAP